MTEYFSTQARRTTVFVIAGNFAFFAALLAVMFYLRSSTMAAGLDWPTPFHFASLLMVAALTMFSLCGSATMMVAARAAKLDDTEPAVRWVAIAISCWFTFLFLEIVEWVRLVYLEQLGPRTAFGGSFLLLTGTHWIAAVVALCWFTYVAIDIRNRDVLAAAMYSHFLNIWWLVLMFSLYVPNANLQGI